MKILAVGAHLDGIEIACIFLASAISGVDKGVKILSYFRVLIHI